MAGMGPPPKPDDQRRRRNAATFEWMDLPADGRAGDPPPLPGYRGDWHELVVEWWDEVWATPQATQWDPSGITMWPVAELLNQLAKGDTPTHTVMNAVLPWWRDHGLTPKALLDRRWRVTPTLVPGGREQVATVTLLHRADPEPPPPPAARDRKAAWVEHAVACGLDREVAEPMSKSELIKRFGVGAPTPPNPPRAKARALSRLQPQTD